MLKIKDIKFRGKRIDNREWIYGSLILTKTNAYITEGICPTGTFDLNFTKYEVGTNTIGQYTGLKDKNGKKIYERRRNTKKCRTYFKSRIFRKVLSICN